MTPNPHYMASQRELGWHMRRVLVDWLIQVHSRFRLLPETLFLTVNIIDRFLTIRNVPVDKLQLVGATAILIASKYEEITCPSVDEIVFMVDNGYSREEILEAEHWIQYVGAPGRKVTFVPSPKRLKEIRQQQRGE